jgi:tetratricopeptide (TPR) repeat protein
VDKQLLDLLEKGFQQQQTGNLSQAEQTYLSVLEHDRDNVHALNLLGMLCVNDFRPDEAVFFITKALKKNSNNPESHANIALAFKDQGNFEKAREHFRQSIRLHPENPTALNNLGNVLREMNQPENAAKVYERALRLAEDFAECWSNLAAALKESEQFKAAHRAVQRALDLSPDIAQAHNNKGDILLAEAKYQQALLSYQQAIVLNPKYTTALINMAKAQRDMDDPDAALETLQKALQMDPQNPEAHHVKGVLLEQTGEPEQAATCFQKAIDLAPGMTIAHYFLAQIKGRESSDAELAAMLSVWGSTQMLANDKMYLAFGLARVYEQRQQYDEAFAYLEKGNRIKADLRPYNDEETRIYIDSLVSSATTAATRLEANTGNPDSRLVFVLGMPRSGTSLTEQILASHSEIAGAGELSYAYDMVHLIRDITHKKFPDNMASLTAHQYRELGEYYLSRHHVGNLKHQYLVDKTPLNFQYIGVLGLVFPNAKFIHCHRDAVQNCFSIHKMPFDQKQTYAHDLTALGKYYKRYRHLMQCWHELFPGRILDVAYEDTVTDIETQSRCMLKFLDLDFEDSVLQFHKTERLVKTPSAGQVRQPIYSDAMQSWKKYEKHLQPLIAALKAD